MTHLAQKRPSFRRVRWIVCWASALFLFPLVADAALAEPLQLPAWARISMTPTVLGIAVVLALTGRFASHPPRLGRRRRVS